MAYDAFISYSHGADTPIAEAIQRGLHDFARPWYRRRALNVFRDSTGLAANPALWTSISEAMGDSEYLIVLCSPDSAQSPWVAREIEEWVATKPKNRILPVLVAGELAWDDAARSFDPVRSTAASAALATAFTEEPLYVDMGWALVAADMSLRTPKFQDQIADLAAPLHGVPKDQLIGDDIRQHRRTLRLAWGAAAIVMLLGIAAVAGAVVAVRNADEARRVAEDKVRIQGELDARKRELRTINAELTSQKSKLDDAEQQTRDAQDEATRARGEINLAELERDAAQGEAADAQTEAGVASEERDVAQEQAAAATADAATAQGQAATAQGQAAAASNDAVVAQGRASSALAQQVVAESARASADLARLQADAEKQKAEADKATAEGQRKAAQDASAVAELARLSAQSDKVFAESVRDTALDAKNQADQEAAAAAVARDAAQAEQATAISARDAARTELKATDLANESAQAFPANPSLPPLLANQATQISDSPPTRRALTAAVQGLDPVQRFFHFTGMSGPPALGRVSASPDGKWIVAAETSDAIDLGLAPDTTHLYAWRADDPSSRAVEVTAGLNCVADLQWLATDPPLLVTIDRLGGSTSTQPDCGGDAPLAGSPYRDARVLVWDVENRTAISLLGNTPALSLLNTSPVAISPDGHFLVVAADLGVWGSPTEPFSALAILDVKTLDTADPHFAFISARPGSFFTQPTFSAHGSYVLGYDLASAAPAVWETASWESHCFGDPQADGCFSERAVVGAWQSSPRMAPDEQTFAVASEDLTLAALVDAVTGDVIGLRNAPAGVADLAVDDTRVAISAFDGKVSVSTWDPNDSGVVVNIPAPGAGCLEAPAFSGDTRLLFVEPVCPDQDPFTFAVDLDANRVLHQMEGRLKYQSPDGRYVVAGRTRVDVSLLRVFEDFELWDFGAQGGNGVRAASRSDTRFVVSSDGGLLAGYRPHYFLTPDAPVEVWRLTPAGVLDPETLPASLGTRALTFATNDAIAGVGTMGSGVQWDLAAGHSHLYADLYRYPGEPAQAPCSNPDAFARETLLRSALSPDAKSRAVSHDAQTVELVELASGARTALPDLGLGAEERIDSLKFSADGQSLLVNVQVPDPNRADFCVAGDTVGSVVVRLATVPPAVDRFPERVLTSSGDGTRLLFASLDDRSVIVRDATTLADVAPAFTTDALGADPDPAFPRILTINTTGGSVAGTDRTGRAVVWTVDGAVVDVLDPPGSEQPLPAPLYGIAFSPDGSHLAVKTIGQRLVVWDLAHTDEPPLVATLPSDAVARVVYSPDGSLIAVDGTYLFDATTLTQASSRLRPLHWNDSTDRGAQATRFLAENGALYLLVERTHEDAAVRWRIDLTGLRAAACDVAGRNFTSVEFERYVGGAYIAAPCSDRPKESP